MPRMPWEIQEKVLTLEASGGTPGQLDWMAAAETRVADGAVQIVGILFAPEFDSELHVDGGPPLWRLFEHHPISGVRNYTDDRRLGLTEPFLYEHSYFQVTNSLWRVTGENLAEGDSLTATFYYWK